MQDIIIAIIIIGALAGSVITGMAEWPKYNIYSSRLSGKAELAKAEFNRQVLVKTAKAKEDAAKYVARADIIRASGVAKANRIIGQSLEHNEDYLTWKFIDELPQNKNQIIYVPFKGQIPFTEAGRAINHSINVTVKQPKSDD